MGQVRQGHLASFLLSLVHPADRHGAGRSLQQASVVALLPSLLALWCEYSQLHFSSYPPRGGATGTLSQGSGGAR